jgi:uncharacterized protein (DUF58 family)
MLGFVIPWMETVGLIGLLILFAVTLLDSFLIFSTKDPLSCERSIQSRLNLGDENHVSITIHNNSPQPIFYQLTEGYPVQLQERFKTFKGFIHSNKSNEHSYSFTPKSRGKYVFEDIYIQLSSVFKLVDRLLIIPAHQIGEVYPSVEQMRKYELLVFSHQKTSSGIKQIRRLGNNSEFEQIKTYVQGDELKSINWKATSRSLNLMVNQYQEQKSQQVYCIVDKSRSMQVEFENLSMLDYAINSSLVFTNIAIRKSDKAGLLTFSDKIGTHLTPESSKLQLRRILECLYNQKTHFNEGNYELLYHTIRTQIKTRSLLMLFTNFETESSMRRALPLLRKMNKKHVLVIIFFQNNELEEMAFQNLKSTADIYQSTVAERLINIKSKIAQELNKNGIQTILTRPEDLSVKTINKYLELKAKGIL